MTSNPFLILILIVIVILSHSSCSAPIAEETSLVSSPATPQATRWARASRTQLEEALLKRGLPLTRVNDEYWGREMEGLDRLGCDNGNRHQ